MNNYSNNKPHDPHDFREEVKIKYDVINAMIGTFPNGTGAMVDLLGAAVPAQDLGLLLWANPCRTTRMGREG